MPTRTNRPRTPTEIAVDAVDNAIHQADSSLDCIETLTSNCRCIIRRRHLKEVAELIQEAIGAMAAGVEILEDVDSAARTKLRQEAETETHPVSGLRPMKRIVGIA
jgi:hypothetical protein